MRRMFVAAGVVALIAGAAGAVVVPNSAAGVEADGTFSLTSTAAGGRTYQFTIAAGQLSGLVGQQIGGMKWRLNGAATAPWPAVTTTYAAWDVFIGPGVSPALMSNTFAANFTGAATQVRSGGWTVNVNDFSSGASPNAFGPTLDFTTPYLYSGGDLVIEMRFSSQVGATNQPAFDAVLASGTPLNGWGVDFAGRWTGNSAGVTGGNGNCLVTEFVVSSGGCRPDLTTTAAPGSVGYGVPDGQLNSEDFFYYLAQYAANNVAVCDLTNTAVPGSPGYGVPNGILNSEDFFYYLAIYAAGC